MMLAGRGRTKIRPPRRYKSIEDEQYPKMDILLQLLSFQTFPNMKANNMRGSQANVKLRQQGLGSNDEVDFDTTWAILASSLREIHTKNASQLSFEALYRNAYKLVLKKLGEQLYFRVKDFEEAWLTAEVLPRVLADLSTALLVDNAGTSSLTTANERRAAGEKMLVALKKAWEDHNLCMNMTSDILMYMERVYCTDNRKPSVFAAAMAQFRDHVLRAPLPSAPDTKIIRVLLSVMLDQIRMEREGDIIDKTLIRSCAYMLEGLYESEEDEENLKLYLTEFEPAFLSATREFYRAEGTSLIQEADAGTFCRHAMKRADEEQDRCRSTLSALTSPKVKLVVDDELIKNNIAIVINMPNGVKYMLDNDRLGELRLVFELISRVDPKKEELRKAIQKIIVELGTEINRSAANPSHDLTLNTTRPEGDKPEGEGRPPADKSLNLQTTAAIKWVDDILELKGKYDKVLNDAFAADQSLQTAFARSFTDFINEFERSSEYLSLFFDENLKKGIKGKTENEVDILLDKGITLLRYIQDKDMFERYYKKHLSKRLLMKRSVSMDAERQMISKMKMEVGNTFTQRIESMFKDMAISEDLSAQYKRHVSQLGDPDPKRADIEVNVLTSTMWPLDTMGPSYRDNETSRPLCIFPSQIERIKLGFEKYYLDKHSGRRLTWQANMGTADLRAYFPEMKGNKKTRELNVSTYAMVILLLFNDLAPGASYTCEEIQDKTNIPTNELMRNLQSLAVAQKGRVLTKEPMSKDVKLTDRFFFNEHFYSQFQKVKIGVVTSGNRVEEHSERKDTEKRIDDARVGTIEAALVRIMKQRKELSHQNLVTEAIQQLLSRFRPDPMMIKARIESLIDRDYLARIEDREPPAYRYLA